MSSVFLNESHADGLKRIAESIGRHKGTFSIARTDPRAGGLMSSPFSLSLGAPNVVKVTGGTIVSLGLTKERLRELRDACDALLNSSPLDELVE